MRCQIIAHALHNSLFGAVKRHIGHLVKTYEVHAALQPAQQTHQLSGMSHAVVHTAEYDVFEREPALMAEIVVPQRSHNLLYGICLLGRHDGGTLFSKSVVEADGQMAFTLVEE